MKLVSLNRWALRLQPLHRICLPLAIAGWVILAWQLLVSSDPKSLVIRLLIILTLWAMVLVSFINLFKSPAPAVLPSLDWRHRLGARFLYGLYYLMTLVFAGIVLVAVALTVKLLLLSA
jgi:hypothetical protein